MSDVTPETEPVVEKPKAAPRAKKAATAARPAAAKPAAAKPTAAKATVAKPAGAKPAAAKATVAKPAVVESVVVEPTVTEDVPPVTTDAPSEVVVAPTPEQVIIVDAPVAPRAKGNRGLGVFLALLATILYTALFALGVFAIGSLSGGPQSFAFLTEPTFYFAPLFFFVGAVLVILVLNRSGWWSHIIGSVVVAAIVYFGTAGALLVAAGVAQMTRGEATDVYLAGLANPITITAALIAREVAIWLGAILARRGRRLKVRNAEARADFEREQAALTPTA